MEKVIVITSIFPPTDGAKKFAKQKTLVNWESPRVEFISLAEQMECFGHLAELIILNVIIKVIVETR